MNPTEPSKLIWLGVFALCWVFFGITGRDAWQNDEARALAPVLDWLAGSASIWASPTPLFTALASALAKWSPFALDVQNSARLASGVFMLLALIGVSQTARHLFGVGFGPAAALALMGGFGLLLRAHAFIPEIAWLASWSLLLWAVSAARLSPRFAGGLMGLSLALLALGLRGLPDLLLALGLLLALLFLRSWQDGTYRKALSLGLALGAGLIVIGGVLIHQLGQWDVWWQWHGTDRLVPSIKMPTLFAELAWFAWPLWPLALAGVWHDHRRLARSPNLQLPALAVVVLLLAAVMPAWSRLGGLLPVLLPLALLAAYALETLRRGAAQAFYWFGVLCFLFFATAFWVYFVAIEWAVPARLGAHVAKLTPNYVAGSVEQSQIGLAMIATLIWLIATPLFPRAKTRPVLVWATGMALVWVLLATLFRPWAEAGWGYKPMLMEMSQHLPARTCLELKTDEATAIMARYHLSSRLQSEPASGCAWRLVQSSRNKADTPVAAGVKVVWEGVRTRNKDQPYRLEYDAELDHGR